MYKNSTSKVKLENRGIQIDIQRGVRQGDPLSPKLFIAVLEYVFRKVTWAQGGIYIDGNYMSHLRFANDIAILSEQPEELETMINMLNQESYKVGLEMNPCKTKIMTNSLKRDNNRRK